MKERPSPKQPHDDTPKVRGLLTGGPDKPASHDAVWTVSPSTLRAGRLPTGLRRRLGAVLLAIAIVTVIVSRSWPGGNPPSPGPAVGDDLTVVKGYGGELKVNFLTDSAVTTILAEEYGLRVDITKRGSIELACGMPLGEDVDFVWLGDSVALAKYRDLGCTDIRADNVYNSPVVLYSWAPVVDALVAAGLVETTADGAYTLDFAHLVDLMTAGTTWTDIGLPQLHGRIVVHTTDPTKSNSGLLFAGMLANTLNGGDVVNATTVTPLLPDIQSYFQRLGLMEPTSGDLFEQFLITGMGAKPIVALYESQIQEFLDSNPSYRDQITAQVRVLYPQPTVWATHPFVVRTDNANRLLTALKDHDIQRLAWKHGQRPGDPAVVIDPAVVPVPGILPQVTSVTSMPALEVMNRILAEISQPPDGVTPNSATGPLVPIGALTLIGQATLAARDRQLRSPERRHMMSALHTYRTAARRLGLLIVISGLLAPGAGVAQDTGEAAITAIVSWTAPFEGRTDLRAVPSASHEIVLSNEDDYVVVANGDFAPANARLSALEALGAHPDTLVSVDAGTQADSQYWLDLVTVQGTPYGAFTLGRTVDSGVTLVLFLGQVTTFADGMAQAQELVLVDEAPIFQGVEPAGLQAMLEVEMPNLVTGDDVDEDAAPAATVEAPDESDEVADQPGMVSEGTYESPHHRFALTWTDEWMFDPAYEAPVVSDVNYDFDEVHLTVDSPLWVWFGFYAGALPPGGSFSDFMDRSSSPGRLAFEIGPSAELVVSRIGINADGNEVGALIIRVTQEGYDFIVYEEYRTDDNGRVVAALQLLMLVDDVEGGLRASESLAFEDGPVITLFTPDEILSVARDATFLDGNSTLILAS
jgi:hypothetical protein